MFCTLSTLIMVTRKNRDVNFPSRPQNRTHRRFYPYPTVSKTKTKCWPLRILKLNFLPSYPFHLWSPLGFLVVHIYLYITFYVILTASAPMTISPYIINPVLCQKTVKCQNGVIGLLVQRRVNWEEQCLGYEVEGGPLSIWPLERGSLVQSLKRLRLVVLDASHHVMGK